MESLEQRGASSAKRREAIGRPSTSWVSAGMGLSIESLR
jgi:hypothetical protein